MRSEYKLPGVSICVAYQGRLVWFDSRGFADLKRRTPLTPRHRFRIGSTSKALTSIAIGQLVEQGRLDLDASIQSYVPSFPEKEHPITVRLLAGHQAGIRNYDFAAGEYNNTRRYRSVTEALNIFKDDPLLFEPGTRYSYTTYGYTLISAALERASGTDFLSYMEASVFAPLGMQHTSADDSQREAPDLVTFYALSAFTGQIQEVRTLDSSNKWAGGGFVSTPTDLARLGNALINGEVLKPETLALLFTPQKLRDGNETGAHYGIGWRSGSRKLPSSGREVRIVHHGGTANGALSFLVLFPEENMVISMQTNLFFKPFWDFAKQSFRIAELFLDKEAGATTGRPNPDGPVSRIAARDRRRR